MPGPSYHHTPSAEEADTIRSFARLLDSEEEGAKRLLLRDTRGIAMRVALNELDWHRYILESRVEATKDLIEASYFGCLGLARIVCLMLRMHGAFSLPTITLRREGRLSTSVLDVATSLGFIEHGRRVAERAWAGVAHANRTAPNRFDFKFSQRLLDPQAHERDIEEYYRTEAGRLVLGITAMSASGKKIRAEVGHLLRENVYVWRDHWMGYRADTVIDNYFFQLAWNSLCSTPEYDAFNEQEPFGGVPFLTYLLASAYLVSLCFKHRAFCEALVEKDVNIRIEDILTISADRDEFIETMCEALNQFGRDFKTYTTTGLAQARVVYEIVALTRRNVGLIDKVVPPIPIVIEFSETAIVQHLAGRDQQMEFLLYSLKSAYARDFSLAQNRREASMQRALDGFLKRHFPEAIVRGNVRLRHHGRTLTDVDYTAFDPVFGDLLLFQLKYQEHHHADFKAQTSRMTRLAKESAKWLAAVDVWLSESSNNLVQTTFRLPNSIGVTRIRKVIVARHHTYPLGTNEMDNNTAFASWLQLVNAGELMQVDQGDFRTLNGLFRTLRRHIVAASERYYTDLESIEFRLPSVSFVVRQSEESVTSE